MGAGKSLIGWIGNHYKLMGEFIEQMPVKRVQTTRNGRPVTGYRWGSSGRIYTGPGAEQRAQAQGRAAYASGYRSKGRTK